MTTSRVDAKKRIVLPGGQPGDIFDVQQQEEGQILLVRLGKPPAPSKRMSRQVCKEAMRQAPLRPTKMWEELRKLTREP